MKHMKISWEKIKKCEANYCPDGMGYVICKDNKVVSNIAYKHYEKAVEKAFVKHGYVAPIARVKDGTIQCKYDLPSVSELTFPTKQNTRNKPKLKPRGISKMHIERQLIKNPPLLSIDTKLTPYARQLVGGVQ